MRTALLFCAPLLALPVTAQVLPGSLPQLPRVDLPVRVPKELTGPQLNDALANTRQARITELLEQHPDVLERDREGEPVVRAQIVALDLSADDQTLVIRRGYTVLDASATGLTVLQAPAGKRLRRALRELRRLVPGAIFDFNHLYLPGSVDLENPGTGPSPAIEPTPDAASSVVRVGLVDSGVDASHPVFRNLTLRRLDCGTQASIAPHGTAVASLLAGDGERFTGAIRGAMLFTADIYCDRPTGGNLFALAKALDWLAQEQVPVINLSLVGPPNRVLEQRIARLVPHGHLIVAAVGNDGPAAAPLYPAAYPGVVAVTGVDSQRRVLIEAGRGDHVDFAAPGAGMAAALPGGEFGIVRGTSFAAPLVAGLLAGRLAASDLESAEDVLNEVARDAVDLGAAGRDRIYGDGLLGENLAVAPERVGARSAVEF